MEYASGVMMGNQKSHAQVALNRDGSSQWTGTGVVHYETPDGQQPKMTVDVHY